MTESVDHVYANKVYSKYGYLANWPPGAPIALGDVGTLREALFARRQSLGPLGERRTGGVQSSHFQGGEVSFEIKVARNGGSAFRQLGGEDMGVAVTFREKGAFFIQLLDCQEVQVEDLDGVRGKMRVLREAGEIEPGDVVVTRVLETLRSTVLISEKTSGRVELRAPGTVAADGLAKMSRNDLSEFVPVYQSGMYQTMFGQAGVIPLFGGLRLRERPWTKRTLIEELVHGDRGERGIAAIPDDDPWFDRVGPR